MYKFIYDSPIGLVTFFHREGILEKVLLPGHESFCSFSFENAPEKDFPKLKAQVKRYFNGEKLSIDIPFSLDNISGFTKDVLLKVHQTSWGMILTYREISIQLKGSPDYSRAVGGALKKNPLPLIIPCHRVVRTNGYVGGFSGGTQMKKSLLKLEGFNF